MEVLNVMLIIGLAIYIPMDVINADCNVCQFNQAACINSTSFHLCFGEDTPNTDMLFHCKEGFECTDLEAICVQTNNARRPSCGDTTLCGMCSAHRNYVFACLSRTTFQMCYGALRPTGPIGYCPDGYVCDANSDDFCVSINNPHTITCDVTSNNAIDLSPTTITTKGTMETTNENGVTSTNDITTQDTSSSQTIVLPLTANEVCTQKQETGLFPTTPRDPFCRRYIYCFYRNGIISGIEYTCSGTSYYNIEDEMCTLSKPSYCI